MRKSVAQHGQVTVGRYSIHGPWNFRDRFAGFCPKVLADEVAVLAKGDRLEVRSFLPNCSKQVWPDFTASCLRNAGSGAKIAEARLVTARR